MNDRVPFGILLGVGAYSLFSIHDAANKWLVGSFPVWQVMAFRSGFIVIACLVAGRTKLVARAIETPLKLPLIGRGAITMTAWMLYFTAARHVPLAQLMTLYFSAPIITTLLAIPLLGERVNRARWISLGLGFSGVLAASDPFGLKLSLDTVMVLAAAGLWGYAIILMRQIARKESSLLQMLFQNLCFLVVTLPLTIFTWVTPDPLQLTVLLSIGVMGACGQYMLFEGCRLAPASVMGTVEYTGLLWAFLLGYWVFGDIPSMAVTLGAALISCAGVYLFVTERRAASV